MEKLDLLGIGNAVVDVLYEVDEDFIKKNNLQKGVMTLIDETQAEQIYSSLEKGIEVAGGSVANSTVGFASLSGRPAFIGKIKNDNLGKSFSKSLANPDAQRTMNTYIGACSLLNSKDIDENLVKNSKITYLEGYCWEEQSAKESLIKAAEIAHKSENKVALTLSDPFCVERHRNEFIDLIKKHIDILFANEIEIKKLCETNDFEESGKKISSVTEIAALTQGENGAKIYSNNGITEIKPKIFGQVLYLLINLAQWLILPEQEICLLPDSYMEFLINFRF